MIELPLLLGMEEKSKFNFDKMKSFGRFNDYKTFLKIQIQLFLKRFAFTEIFFQNIDTELAFLKALQATLNSMDSKKVFGIYYVSQKNASIWHFCC
jgi:hypothetical protein